MGASEIVGRAYNYRLVLNQIWDKIGGRLLKAQTEAEVIVAFGGTAYQREFQPLAALILQVLREPDFPKRDAEARANFLGESLAARGELTPRTSRDICARERAKQRRKTKHHIIRHEYYVECSCGYRGPARDNACRKCGAEIELSLDELMGRGLF